MLRDATELFVVLSVHDAIIARLPLILFLQFQVWSVVVFIHREFEDQGCVVARRQERNDFAVVELLGKP